MFGFQIAIVERLQLALGAPQIEEQLLLRGRGAHFHEAPRAQDVFLNRGADPPHGICREAEALIRVEPLYGLHQPDVAFGDDFANRQAIAAVAHRDARDEPQMRRHELFGGVRVLMLLPTFGEHEFLIGREHRKFAYLFEISRQPERTAGQRRKTSCMP